MTKQKKEVTIALAGNPNVGKSSLFNALTGLHQHTGNWTGKTVETALGYRKENETRYRIFDLPGTYSLLAHSREEEAACEFLCFEAYDGVAVVCDATHLARNLGLVLQILELEARTVVILNFIDEAQRLHAMPNTKRLSALLGVPVIETSAAMGTGISELLSSFAWEEDTAPHVMRYGEEIENAVSILLPSLSAFPFDARKKRFFALRLLESDDAAPSFLARWRHDGFSTEHVENAAEAAKAYLEEKNIPRKDIAEIIATRTMERARALSLSVMPKSAHTAQFSPTDRLLTGKRLGIPVMFLLLLMTFWLTIVGANYPSQWLSSLFDMAEAPICSMLRSLRFSVFWTELLVFGVYRTLTWIVSVMLPPMLIFFPLFTILEDIGYLPRIAFNLDGVFCKCGACGKQGLTMCMGLGCNAVGVTGARIIDSSRERLLSILTNVFMPCNGRFPAMITVAAMFLSCGNLLRGAWLTALILALTILLGVGMTFLISWGLSHTLLRGTSASFLLELPPYRRPKIGKILIRSFLDRTVFVLLRAITVAIPAGILIFLLSHTEIQGVALTTRLSDFLNPLGSLMGLDGVILLAFLLGLPANEIVLPLCVMLYLESGILTPLSDPASLIQTLSANGWTWQTAICFLLFSVMHAPCTTTLLTIKKETGSLRYMLLAFLIPTLCGILFCTAAHFVMGLLF